MKKTYFISPNFDIPPPPTGPLKLGHIIPGPSEPDIEPLNTTSHTPPPNLYPIMTKSGFTSSRSNLLSGTLGLWAQVAGTIGANLSTSASRSSNDKIKIQTLETQAFQPSESYVMQACQAEDVLLYLKQTKFRVPVYMITGLKIARGCEMSEMKEEGRVKVDGGVKTGLEGVNVGPKVGMRREKEEGEGFEGASDFVLAFRIQRIRVKMDGEDLKITDRKTQVKGAKMLDGEQEGEKEKDVSFELEEGADELPPEVKSLDGVHEDDDDGGQPCDIVLLR